MAHSNPRIMSDRGVKLGDVVDYYDCRQKKVCQGVVSIVTRSNLRVNCDDGKHIYVQDNLVLGIMTARYALFMLMCWSIHILATDCLEDPT